MSQGPQQLNLLSTSDSAPLQIQVANPGPHAGQLLIVSPKPQRSLAIFTREAIESLAALREVWPGVRQSLHRDVTVRHLYEVTGDHAFKFLWESRLGQREQDLSHFGRPVSGGGLRFVMPPVSRDPQCEVQVKIESYLRNPRQLYVEVVLNWNYVVGLDDSFDVGSLLKEAEDFATGPVVHFINVHAGENGDHA
ncbi:MAG: hypothetical protein ACC662_02775 [Planctomycetota bacterium]